MAAKKKNIVSEGQMSIEDIAKSKHYEDMHVTRGSNVVQSNYLIENKPKMTLYELKMFSTLVATINKDDQDLKNIKIKVTDVVDLWGISRKHAYERVKQSLAGLLDKKFALETIREDGRREINMTTYINKFTYVEGAGTAQVEINDMFRPFLLDLKEKYTLLGLENVLELESTAAIRTYELLKQYELLGQRSFTVADYKKKVGIEDKYKGNNSNLKKYVLNNIVEEISNKTNILTRYGIEGRGEKAVIHFSIYKKEDISPKKREEKLFLDGEKDLLMQLLKDEYDIDTIFPDDMIRRSVDIAMEGIKDKKEINIRFKILKEAFLEFQDRKATTDIKNDWAYFKRILESKREEVGL